MAEYQRDYPRFSACGLNCGLCPRYHTAGASRCPGCAGAGFAAKHPPCGVLSCALRRGLEYCFLCDDYPCQKYKNAGADSFITHRNMARDAARAKADGMAAYRAGLDEKVDILRRLLDEYNSGRQKSFYCLAVNLLGPADLEAVMERLAAASAGLSQKEKSALAEGELRAMAEARGVALTLDTKR